MNSFQERGMNTVKNYVGNKLVESGEKGIYPVYNPAFGEVIAETPETHKEDVNKVVDNAYAAFLKWSKVPVTDRIKHLFNLERLVREHSSELTDIITIEHGKTRKESEGEVMRVVENIQAGAASTYHIMGKNNLNISAGIDEELFRVPIGVFAVVAPFNFPLMVPFWFIPYAVGLGNSVVVKPSEKVPLSMQLVSELFREAGFPENVVSTVNGGRETVDALLENRHVSGVSFVGSTRTGEAIYRKGAEYHKRVQAGTSAKNYELVMPDADVAQVIPGLISSFFGNAGQRCLAGSVVVTLPENHAKVVSMLSEATGKMRLGYGLDQDADMGPLNRQTDVDRVRGYIDRGVDEGAKLVIDGREKRSEKYPKGFFMGASVMDNASPDMIIVRDEIFGPVASIIEAKNFDDAIEIINKSRFGNASTIFTKSGYYARQFTERVEAGNLGINIGVAAPIAFYPFAGWKDSFFGDLHGQGGEDHIHFFTEKKVVISRWSK